MRSPIWCSRRASRAPPAGSRTRRPIPRARASPRRCRSTCQHSPTSRATVRPPKPARPGRPPRPPRRRRRSAGAGGAERRRRRTAAETVTADAGAERNMAPTAASSRRRRARRCRRSLATTRPPGLEHPPWPERRDRARDHGRGRLTLRVVGLAEGREWYQVETQDGQRGFIYGQLIRPKSESEPRSAPAPAPEATPSARRAGRKVSPRPCRSPAWGLADCGRRGGGDAATRTASTARRWSRSRPAAS